MGRRTSWFSIASWGMVVVGMAFLAGALVWLMFSTQDRWEEDEVRAAGRLLTWEDEYVAVRGPDARFSHDYMCRWTLDMTPNMSEADLDAKHKFGERWDETTSQTVAQAAIDLGAADPIAAIETWCYRRNTPALKYNP